MSRLIPCRDMSADQVIQCSYDAMAIIALCENTAWDLSERGENAQLAGNISTALKLAGELLDAVHDTLEIHEGVISAAKSTALAPSIG
jgi:hypothetical protein